MTEGVIKFECRWEQSDSIGEAMLRELRPARAELKRAGLIGVNAEGIGYGNISVRYSLPSATSASGAAARIRATGFIITASQTGHLDTMGPEGYSYVYDWDTGRNRLYCAGLAKASSESMTHAILYDLLPDIGAVIHIHSPEIWSHWSQDAMRTSSDAAYGTPEMAAEIKRVFNANNMGAEGSVCMGGHEDGIVAWGRTMEGALAVVRALVKSAGPGAGRHAPHDMRSLQLQSIDPVRLDDTEGFLVLLDQTALPQEVRYLRVREQKDIHDAIYRLKVRGAPAIGIAAAYAVYLAVRDSHAASCEVFLQEFIEAKTYLATARPTAVNLFWALDRMEACVRSFVKHCGAFDIDATKHALRVEAEKIRDEDEASCRQMGEYSLSLLKPGWGLLTHCNAGALATARYGTALASMYLGTERGYDFKVYADETRPLLQGARLTAWELQNSGIDVTLICDNMASIVMKEGKVQAVLVGCDRVAANGDSANKIGTSGLAILARHYGIPFYIHAPMSTIDFSCPTGADIVIEERPATEITEAWYVHRMAPEGVKVYNPAFDVTDKSLITAIITERGIAWPPFGPSLARLREIAPRETALREIAPREKGEPV